MFLFYPATSKFSDMYIVKVNRLMLINDPNASHSDISCSTILNIKTYLLFICNLCPRGCFY